MQEAPDTPQVSIIIPVYNAEPYLRRCLASVLAQTTPDWECICVDDGSTDGGGALLDEFAAKDSRFVVIHKENGGISSARNAGLEAARGEYIGFIDNDDWIEAETYETALEAAQRTDADFVQCRYVAETKDGPRPSKECVEGEFNLAENPEYYSSTVWNKIFRASLVAENQMRFPLDAKIGGEDALFSSAAYCYAKKAYFINRALYHHIRTHVSTSTRKVTHGEIMGLVAVTKETCEYIGQCAEMAKDGQARQAFADIIFGEKMYAKGKALNVIPKPDYRLYRSIFPELNREFLPRFIRLKTKASLIQLLYAWRMGWLVKALVWTKRILRRLAGRG